MHTMDPQDIAASPFCHQFLDLEPDSFSNLKIYVSQYGGTTSHLNVREFRISDDISYWSFCDDFGPMGFLSLSRFLISFDQEIQTCASQSKHLVFCAEAGPRSLTNAAFLLGAFLLLRRGAAPDDAHARFAAIPRARLEDFRDATYGPADFRLRLIDCWRGLARAQRLGWIAAPSPDAPTLWGMIDAAEYELYDNPLNGDLHAVVPGRFIAFKGPKDLGGRDYLDVLRDGRFQARHLGPEYYARLLPTLGVSTVVRLNDACYDRRVFFEGGIDHHDLYFDDCTPPPPATVRRFLAVADAAAGAVAVHCKAGLGRTGTLIALSLIRSHGFSAREAVGWLRIMRPGSVIGRQQDFLCNFEAALLHPPPVGDRALRRPDRRRGEEEPAALGGAAPGGDAAVTRTDGLALSPRSAAPAPSAPSTRARAAAALLRRD
jgi:cell division cycle 14